MQSGFNLAKWLYLGKSDCNQAKVDVIGQRGCFWAKVVLFGQELLHSGKSGYIPSKWL